jgi:pimeloyl-ACP methyl ester carboxylesterase
MTTGSINRSFARFTYAFIDIRGYGSSRGIEGEYTMAEIARDVVVLAEERGREPMWSKN